MSIADAAQLDDLAEQELLDVIVIGAGPAGSSAATLLARQGLSVLLVDKQAFPRDKVCGSCLSGRAVNSLRHLGLSSAIDDAVRLTEFVLATGGRQVRLGCSGGCAISRRLFDDRLASLAVAAGARFLSNTLASAGTVHQDHREVRLMSGGEERVVSCRLVLVCSGLGKASQAWGLTEQIARQSRIGLTAYTDANSNYPPGSIAMCVEREGYLGITVLEDGRLNLSACVDRKILASIHPTELATDLIRRAGLPVPDFSTDHRWMGTPALSRQLDCPAAHRLLVLGDAAGYAEPFTGQGMAWALEAATDVAAIAEQAVTGWDDSLIRNWQQQTRRRQKSQQRICNLMKALVRRPLAVSAAIGMLRFFPGLASPVIRGIHQS